MNLYKSFCSVGLLTIFSRIMGFVREILIATELGASAVTDAIKIAIKVPSLFRRIFAEGAFNASFVPLFSDILEKEPDKKSALSFGEYILSWLTISLCILTLIVELLIPSLFKIMFSSFDPERLAITIKLTRIAFPFLIFISLSAFYSGILNSIDRFFFVSSSQFIGNIFIVGFVLVSNALNKDISISFVVAVLGCGIIQFLWVMIPAHKAGFKLKIRKPKITPDVKLFFKKLTPAAFGAGVVQINILIDMWIASSLPKGFISYLDYAERLNQLPLSVIGTAMSTVLLPLLTRTLSQSKAEDHLTIQKKSIEFAFLLVIPSMIGLILWAQPLVGMIYQYGKFSAIDTIQTSNALMAFAFGLPAYVLIKIYSTTLFAQKDTRTPVKIAMLCVGLNLALNLILVKSMQHVGLALATAISAWTNVLLLIFVLKKRTLLAPFYQYVDFSKRLICAVLIVLPLAIWGKFLLCDAMISHSGLMKGFIICFSTTLSFFIFLGVCILTGALNLQSFKLKFLSYSPSEPSP